MSEGAATGGNVSACDQARKGAAELDLNLHLQEYGSFFNTM
jgi:hypothetical protein